MSVSQAQNGRDTIPTPSFSLTWLYLDLLLANPEWILRVAEWSERDLEGNRKIMDFVPSLSPSLGLGLENILPSSTNLIRILMLLHVLFCFTCTQDRAIKQ